MAVNKSTPKPPVDTGEKTISGRTIWNDPQTGEDYSERSTTFEIDGKYYTMPTVSKDGRQHSEDQIRDYVKKYGPVDYLTGEKLPEFRYMEDAIEYAKSRSSTRKKPKAGMSEGGDVDQQTEEALGYAAEGKKFAKEYTPPDVSSKDVVKFVAEMTPVIGDAMAAKEVWDELQKEEINWRMVGILAGAGAVGLVPFFGDAAGKLIKQGASKALKPAKSLDAVATGVPQYKMDGNAPASVFDNTVTQEAVDFIKSGSTSQKDLLRIARDNGIVSGPGTGTMPAQVIAELGDRVRNPDFKVIPNNKKELPPAENSAKTQIAGTLPTYKKADTLLTELAGEGKTLDFGAGLGLSKKELGFDTYEPFPKGDFSPDFVSSADIKDNTYKKVTNLNVLNVVPRSTRDSIVKDIGRILKPDGRAVITTRGRDVLSAKGTSGPEPMSIITSMDTYQKGFTQPELKSYITDTLGKGFEVTNNKLGAAGVTVHKLNTKNFNEGGAVNMDNQMRMFEEGGIADDGMTRDPVSGNEVPPGSLAREVRDDVPAQLSDGEYVVPADVVRFFGVKFFEDLRMTAKQGLQQMEKDGRIGGEPMDSPAPQSGDDPLSPDEQELLQEIMAMEQAPQQPQPSMAVGGVVNAAYGVSVQEGGNVTEDIPISTRTRTTGTNTGTGTGTTVTGKDGMVSVFYIHPDGRRVKVLLLNGKPVGKVPDDFTDFVTDTPENRIKINFQISDETPVGAGTAAGAGTKAPGDDKMEERNQPGGDLYKEPKPKTFEDIGINGADPKAGALAVLGAGKSAIDQGLELVSFGLIGAGIQGITQAEVISIAHANALYAEDVLKNDALAAEIRAEIKTYVDDKSIFLADVITDIAAAFVKPGQNRLNDYEELGGKTAQEESKLSAADIVTKRAEEEKIKKAEIDRIAKEKEDAEKEQARLAKFALEAQQKQSDPDPVYTGTTGQLQKALQKEDKPFQDQLNIIKTTNKKDDSFDKALKEATKIAAEKKKEADDKQDKIQESIDSGSIKKELAPTRNQSGEFGMNKGGLIARPKKKTKKKK